MRNEAHRRVIARERAKLVRQLDRWLEAPMVLLGFVWLGLLVWELLYGLSRALQTVNLAIWALFILHFAIGFILAPVKSIYLKRNWLTAVSLLIPALRAFRFVRLFRILRATRGLRLVRVLTSLNRGMRALGASLGRRGFGYVAALTLLVTIAGAAAMYAFENEAEGGLRTYGEALWWTAMVMTTMGSTYWPQTPEGRVLCLFLALYAFGVFGYVTATLATFFVGRDAADDDAEIPSAASIEALRTEITALRALLERQGSGGAASDG